jgi:hypothetical protein
MSRLLVVLQIKTRHGYASGGSVVFSADMIRLLRAIVMGDTEEPRSS